MVVEEKLSQLSHLGRAPALHAVLGEFDPHSWYQLCSRRPIGRVNGLRDHTVRVRIPSDAPKVDLL